MAGSHSLLNDVYRRHAADVFRYALFLSGDHAQAEDITSETFVRLWTAPGEIRVSTVKAYLFTIARHLFLDERRGRARLAPLDRDIESAARSVEDRVAAQSEIAGLRTLLRRLPEDDRSALLMRAHGVPYDDIARALGATVGAIKVRIHRARKRLLAARISGGTT
jgi:RNA polymerase sigma-70 factor (ECF subfamily)